jgi:hypothetical protein
MTQIYLLNSLVFTLFTLFSYNSTFVLCVLRVDVRCLSRSFVMKISLLLLGFLAVVVTPCPGHISAHGRSIGRHAVAAKPNNMAIVSARAVSSRLLVSTTVKSTVLVIARSASDAQSVTSGLNGYGTPFQSLIVPQGGVAIPPLNTTAGGNFGSVVALSGLAYNCTSKPKLRMSDHIVTRCRWCQWCR